VTVLTDATDVADRLDKRDRRDRQTRQTDMTDLQADALLHAAVVLVLPHERHPAAQPGPRPCGNPQVIAQHLSKVSIRAH
jgi:hypothetical protein